MGAYDYDIPLDEGLDLYRAASDRALARLAHEGISMEEDRPRMGDSYFDGRLPPDWANLNTREIGDLFELMTRHADFMGNKVTLARAAKINATERLKLVYAAVRKSKTGTNDERDDATTVDSRYAQANAEFLEASEYFDILNGIFEAAKRDLTVLSRHIEVRKMEMQGGRAPGRDRFAKR